MPRIKRPHLKIILLLVGIAPIVGAYAASRPLRDFVEYWTAAHLLMAHRNPYSVSEMLQTQLVLGWHEAMPIIPLNPPWTLALFAPLGWTKSYSLAWLAWFLLMTAVVALSSWLLMDLYFGEVRIPEISDSVSYRCLFAFTFFPTLLCLGFGQIAPFVLLGVAGFLHFELQGKIARAGLFLSLTSVKPQLVYLLWVAVFVQFWQQRRWRVLGPIVLVISALTFCTLQVDPKAFGQYEQLVHSYYPRLFASGITAILRQAFGGRDTFWMQFVPPIAGLVWFAIYWRRHRHRWNWVDGTPALVTVSLLTTVWGFVFDQVLLVIPIIALAAMHAKTLNRIPWSSTIWYTGLNGVLILLMAIPPLAFIPAPVLIALRLFHDGRSKLRTQQCL